MSILTIIPAKGHSNRVPNKNLSSLNNKPLLYYTIEAFENIDCVDLAVSTDSEEIADIVSSKNIRIVWRDESLCLPDVHSSAVVIDALQQTSKSYDLISVALPTLPFRKTITINSMISYFKENNSASLISVSDLGRSFSHLVSSTSKPMDFKRLSKNTNFQDNINDQLYSISGYFQISKTSHLKKYCSFHPQAKFFPISYLEGFDINTKDELFIANAIASSLV